MKTEIIILGKNHYNMDGNTGASVVIYGDYDATNNREGISISNASIDYEEHTSLTSFPGVYIADASFLSSKNKAGKDVATLKLKNLQLKEKVKFVADKIV